jgi:hypothetical protein
LIIIPFTNQMLNIIFGNGTRNVLHHLCCTIE